MPHLLHLVSQKESEDIPYRLDLVVQGFFVFPALTAREETRGVWRWGPWWGYTFPSPWDTGGAQLRTVDRRVRWSGKASQRR